MIQPAFATLGRQSRVFTWFLLALALAGCGRSALPLGAPAADVFGDAAIDVIGRADASASDGLDAASVSPIDAAVPEPEPVPRPLPPPTTPPPPTRPPPQCVTPALPLTSLSSCIEALCACDIEAYSRCDLHCWTNLACRIQVCASDPTQAECRLGCSDSSETEQVLGRCFQRSSECSGILR